MSDDDRRRRKAARGALSAEDAALWARVAEQVRPLAKEDLRISHPAEDAAAGAAGRAAPAAETGPRGTPAPAGPRAAPKASRALAPAPPRPSAIDRRTLQRLRRGTIPVEARLDLHGHSQDSAHAALAAFLRAAQRSGRRTVLVITGKGGPPGADPADAAAPFGRGVLRSAVPRWLREPELAAMVLGTAAAGPQHGGSGALYVQLRRERPAGDAPR